MMTSNKRVKPLSGWNVLVVDDEEDSREVARLMLEMAGASVTTAVNGAAAIDKIQSGAVKPHFILSDLSMPVMDGWQLIQQLQEDRATSVIPVIALTAHAMHGDRERALAAGFRNHITKPLSAGKFIEQLMRLLVDMPEFDKVPFLKSTS
jgi:two-component system, cell cycle response regulator DivK